jgi:hypothetical protein
MAELIAPLPRATLVNGMVIAFEAIDPTTGAPVGGVIVSDVAIYANGQDLGEEAATTVNVTLPDSTPLWTPLPAQAS